MPFLEKPHKFKSFVIFVGDCVGILVGVVGIFVGTFDGLYVAFSITIEKLIDMAGDSVCEGEKTR